MNTIDLAKAKLLEMKRVPLMFASDKESYIQRVSTIIEMTQATEFDVCSFYDLHLQLEGNTFIDLHDRFESKWTDQVVDHALHILKVQYP